MYVNVSLVKITWLWWWLPLRLSKRQSPLPTTVLLRTTLTRTIKLHYYLKIIIIKFCKIVKILRALWLVKKQPLIVAINSWKIEVYVIKVTDHILYRFTSVVNVSRCWETTRKKKKKKKEINRLQLGITNFSRVLTTSRVGYLDSKLIERVMNKGGKSPKKLWCCVGVRV